MEAARDRVVLLPGILTLILGVIVFLTPEEFKVQMEFFPFSLAGVVVLALGTFLLVVGAVSCIGDRLSE